MDNFNRHAEDLTGTDSVIKPVLSADIATSCLNEYNQIRRNSPCDSVEGELPGFELISAAGQESGAAQRMKSPFVAGKPPTSSADKSGEGKLPQRPGDKPLGSLPPLPGDKPSAGNLPPLPGDKPIGSLPPLPGDKPSSGNLPPLPGDKPIGSLPPLPGDKPSSGNLPPLPGDKPIGSLPPLPGDKPSERSLPLPTDKPIGAAPEKSFAIDGNRIVAVELLDEPFVTPETKIARQFADAVKGGSLIKVAAAMRNASQNFGSDTEKFGAFSDKLREQLKDQKFDIKNGNTVVGRTINIRREGSTNAVQLEFDTKTGVMSATAYDWVTKKDSGLPWNDVAKEFAGPANPAAENLKDHAQVAKLFDEGRKGGNTADAHKEMLKSAVHAYENGGFQEVTAFEERVKGKIQTDGDKPMFVEENGRLHLVYGEPVTNVRDALKALENPAYAAANNMVRHSEHGFVKIKSRGPSVELKKK